MLASGRGLGAESEEEREKKIYKRLLSQIRCPLMTRVGQ